VLLNHFVGSPCDDDSDEKDSTTPLEPAFNTEFQFDFVTSFWKHAHEMVSDSGSCGQMHEAVWRRNGNVLGP
jgi:hypothetical protein